MIFSLKTIIKTSIIFLIILGFFIPVFASPDAIWTTRNDCGDETQDVNHFSIGDSVYINGEGFSADDYDWEIKGKPGGASCDPGSIVASGTVNVDGSGSFCFNAYTVANDDCGEYQVKLDTKGDNYRVTGEVFSCSDYTTQEDCDYFIDCEWCLECNGKKWSGGSDRCIDVGTCNYACDLDHCGAECLLGQTGDRCLPEGTSIYYCLNNVLYETPEFDSCKDNCMWDNCETKIIIENDPRCEEHLPPPTCGGSSFSSCCNTQPYSFQRPSFNYQKPSFNFPKPSFNIPTFDFSSLFRR